LRSSHPQDLQNSTLSSADFNVNELEMQTLQESGHTFPPEKRLRCRDEFTAVFSKAEHRFRQDKLHLIALGQSLGMSRLGLVIPKKMLKKAVHRNRLKRIIRDNFRRQNWIVPCDVIVSLKQKIDPTELYQQDIHHVINDMFRRLERYCNRKIKH
jgi:ribonuclease P protein component